MMHKYSFPVDNTMAVAQAYDVNASYKDLCIVCDAIRHKKVNEAMAILDGVISKKKPIPFRRFNKHMGARHELHGRKGGYPVVAAKEVKKVLQNAIANAELKAIDPDGAIVLYASANKTRIERRLPPKGSLSWGRGMYGFAARVHSDIEYAKIELAIAMPEESKQSPSQKAIAVKEQKGKAEEGKEKKAEDKGAEKQNRQKEEKKEARGMAEKAEGKVQSGEKA
ncbi:MAG: 50S ribosomal protein L22 [Candidatus Micrarchaeia archaeon]